MNVDQEMDRILARLRQLIRDRGFTQLDVQAELGWGRSYISQILTRQKSLRCEQVLMILGAIDVEPKAFWDSLYYQGEPGPDRDLKSCVKGPAHDDLFGIRLEVLAERLQDVSFGLSTLVRQKQMISAGELPRVTRQAREEAR